MLGGTRQHLSSLLPATCSTQPAPTSPEKHLEGWRQPCCHCKGKGSRVAITGLGDALDEPLPPTMGRGKGGKGRET